MIGKCLRLCFPWNKSLLRKTFHPTAYLRKFAEKIPDHRSPPVLLKCTNFLQHPCFDPEGSPAEVQHCWISAVWEPHQHCPLVLSYFLPFLFANHSPLCAICLLSSLSLTFYPFIPFLWPSILSFLLRTLKQFAKKISYFIHSKRQSVPWKTRYNK